jgi:hypothetical protein
VAFKRCHQSKKNQGNGYTAILAGELHTRYQASAFGFKTLDRAILWSTRLSTRLEESSLVNKQIDQRMARSRVQKPRAETWYLVCCTPAKMAVLPLP